MSSDNHSMDDIDMKTSVEDNEHRAEPPARLTTRFCRNSSSRRRSSAHSSRRSSLSSLHSRTSKLSCHGGPHSTHIAQHLRRASIIETRKARLAERAAHVEQVRLRAAAAKAVPRITYSEEKALAAQAAREKLLAEITARCEEEVRRAKKVAEETKEKRAAEHARLRDEINGKFAEAARRKSVYQLNARRPRTTSLAAVEEKKIDPQVLKKLGQIAAAKVIQRWWRSSRHEGVAQRFLALGLDVSHLKELAFENVTELLSEEKTISTTLRLLHHFRMLDSSTELSADRGAVKVFLSAYMVAAHPVQTFSHGGKEAQEQDLEIKGQALLKPFNSRVREEASHASPTITNETLQFLFNDFTAAFHAWKSQDLNVLVDVMIGSFVNLDLIIQITKEDRDGNVADDYLQAVQHEQIKLLARLKRLAGPDEALSRVRAAVRKARRERKAKITQSSSENVPRSTASGDGPMELSTTIPMTPPPTPPRDPARSDPRASSFVNKLGQTMTVLPSNREIAHEMQINGTYEVQQQPWTDSRKRFMGSLRRSMRESMQHGGQQAAASWTHAMVVVLKDKMMNLISVRHPLYDRIDGFLDVRLIDQQCRNGIFSYESFFETAANLIGQICSPGRDEAIKSFAASTSADIIDRLFALINIIDLMTLDHINFQFRMASRSVIERGHEHEYSMFEKDLQNRVHGLDRTSRWWNSAKGHLAGGAANSASGRTIYARGLVDLVLSNSTLNYNDLPETLHLDYVRLLKLRAKAFHVVATSSILLTSKIRLRRNREALWTKDAERLMDLDVMAVDSTRVVTLIESSHIMPESTKEGLQNFVSRVLPTAASAAKKAKDAEQERWDAIESRQPYAPLNLPSSIESGDVFNEQIATFILKSLREHIFTRLSAASTAESVRTNTSAAETLARAGMPEFIGEVGNIVDMLDRVRRVDLKAHGKWYEQIATEAATSTA